MNKRYLVRYPNGDLCSSYNLALGKDVAKQCAISAAQRIAGIVFFQDEEVDKEKETKIYPRD